MYVYITIYICVHPHKYTHTCIHSDTLSFSLHLFHTIILFSYKNDRLITVTNERVQINKEQGDVGFYELIIPDVLPEDAGTYKCIASNRYGEAECEATVTVTGNFYP